MSQDAWEAYQHIWVCDTEFLAQPGEIPKPICLVAHDLVTGELVKTWLEEGAFNPPFYDEASLFVAFYASAEMGIISSLGWPRPSAILDLYPEFRIMTNGLGDIKASLLGACALLHIDGGDAIIKDTMRNRILEGPPYSEEEHNQILAYCEKDVLLTTALFQKMRPQIDLPRALLRGRYSWTIARIEQTGVPINTILFQKLVTHWDSLKQGLITKIGSQYGVYEGTTFKTNKFREYLIRHGIEWETTASGLPRLDDNFFKDQAKAHPELQPLRELRYTIGQLRLNDLQVGQDGRNRALLSPFRSKTGRNQPSSSRFVFGNAVWLRNLIQPPEGLALAYIDYSQQEFGIGAWLSEDKNMIAAYESGDPYLAFAKQAGAIPPEGTKQTHPIEREQFKTCTIALNYGMSPESFAKRINSPVAKARELYRLHRETYSRYWQWIENLVDRAKLTGRIKTVYGWSLRTSSQSQRTLQNFPMQATGAEILRIACMLCEEAGISVCAPVHDALLIESPEVTIEEEVNRTIRIMGDASYWALGGLRLRAEAKIIRGGEHFSDPRGEEMWKGVWEVIDELETK